MKKFSSLKLILFLVILLAAFLRFYRLAEVPPSLFGDEVDVGYQAYSILKTGRDYMGQPWPISFHSLAEWRTPLFIYGVVPFVWLFGLTELGVRFLPALMGVLCIPAFYLLVKELFLFLHPKGVRSDTLRVSLGLLAALLLAISPWHLQYSRAGFEVTQMLFLIILGVWGFLRGLKSGWWLVLGALCLGLAPYSYNTVKLFVPLLVGLLTISYLGDLRALRKKYIGIALSVFVLVSLPLIYDIFWGQGGSRFSYLSIFNDPTTVPEIGFKRLEDLRVKLEEVPLGVAPTFSSRFFHNKFLSWGTVFLINYFRSFSTEFLFTQGDINLRHSVQGNFGQLYWLEVVFLVLGGFWVMREIRERREMGGRLFLLGLLLLAPIPSALTTGGGNHATRLILMLPSLLILVSLGIWGIWGSLSREAGGDKRKRIFLFLLFTFYFIFFTLYLHRYYVHWPLESEEWWHYGFKQLAAYVKENENKYDYIVWSDKGEPPLIFASFWLKLNPQLIQKNKLEWTQISDAIWAYHLPGTRYYFGHISEERIKANGLAGTLKPNILYLAPEGEIGKDFRHEPVPGSIKLLETIYYPSGRIAKYILSGL